MPILDKHKPGQRSRSYFSRGGPAAVIRDGATSDPYSAAPRWHMTDGVAVVGVVVLGDSNSFGAGVAESWFPKMLRAITPARPWHVANLGVNSARLSSATPALDMNTFRTAYVDPVLAALKLVAFVFGGTNDFFLDDADAATVWARAKVIGNGIHTSHPGSQTIFVTPPPRQNNGTFETRRQSLRTLAATPDAAFNIIADFGGDSVMCANAGSSTNTTYFQPDAIHLSDAGHARLATNYAVPAANTALAALGV